MARTRASFASSSLSRSAVDLVLRPHNPAWRIRIHRFASAALLALLAGGACRAAPPDSSKIAPTYDATGKLRLLTYDSNGDGRPDMWSYMDGAEVVRIEIDNSGDGAIDRREYYTDARTLDRVEIALAHDGRFTRTEFYEGGTIVRAEEDADGNGAADKWETYVNGAVSSVAFDTQRSGRPTRRLVYEANGRTRVETVQ